MSLGVSFIRPQKLSQQYLKGIKRKAKFRICFKSRLSVYILLFYSYWMNYFDVCALRYCCWVNYSFVLIWEVGRTFCFDGSDNCVEIYSRFYRKVFLESSSTVVLSLKRIKLIRYGIFVLF